MSAPAPPPGTVQVNFFGTQITVPTLSSQLQAVANGILRADLWQLVTDGITSPALCAQQILTAAQGLLGGLYALVSVPDASLATAQAIARQVQTAAGFVPSNQWSLATYSMAQGAPQSINDAVAAAFPPPAPPAPAPSNVLVQACFVAGPVTMCYPGPGVTGMSATGFSYEGQSYQPGAVVVDQSSGKKYQASYNVGLGGIGGEWVFAEVPE